MGAPVLPQAFDESTTYISGEQRLMLAVIVHAISEAAGSVRTGGTTIARAQVRAQAIAWFRDQSPDFQLVCLAAGLEPENVSRAALAYIETLEPLRRGQRALRFKRG